MVILRLWKLPEMEMKTEKEMEAAVAVGRAASPRKPKELEQTAEAK